MVSTKQMLKLPQVKVELLTPALEEVTSINMATQALLVLDWLRKFMVDENVSLEESTEKVGQRRSCPRPPPPPSRSHSPRHAVDLAFLLSFLIFSLK